VWRVDPLLKTAHPRFLKRTLLALHEEVSSTTIAHQLRAFLLNRNIFTALLAAVISLGGTRFMNLTNP
jgi:hypothetical protein